MDVSKRTGKVVKDKQAAGERALVLTGKGQARKTLRLRKKVRLIVVARGQRCKGTPQLEVAVDGRRALAQKVAGRRWTSRAVPRALPAGRHKISLRIANPKRGRGCKRAVRVDSLALVPIRAASPVTPPNSPQTQQAGIGGPRPARPGSGS